MVTQNHHTKSSSSFLTCCCFCSFFTKKEEERSENKKKIILNNEPVKPQINHHLLNKNNKEIPKTSIKLTNSPSKLTQTPEIKQSTSKTSSPKKFNKQKSSNNSSDERYLIQALESKKLNQSDSEMVIEALHVSKQNSGFGRRFSRDLHLQAISKTRSIKISKVTETVLEVDDKENKKI